MSTKDYYETLGVTKQATADEIKKSYRKLAVTCHPDRNPGDKQAEDRFKDINEAYAVLSDPDKRKQYDTYGSTDFHQHFSQEDIFRNFNFNDVFSEMGIGGGDDILSRLFGSGFHPGGGRFSARPQRGSDLALDITITFREAALGAEKMVSYVRDGQQEHLNVKVPAGVDTGSKVRLQGKGSSGRGHAAAGDLFLSIRVLPDPLFKREGNDIHVTKTIVFSEACLGTTVDVETLEGVKRVKVPAGIQHGTKIRLKGHGIPILGSKGKGDLFVSIIIHVPEALNAIQQQLIEELKSVGL
ncbi:MAG: DnaJ C-terminal domain-containing protein [Trichlorobacter sp.]|jgi:curved DNA-binding protein